MKDKALIYLGNPCTMCLDAPEIQTLADIRSAGARYCQYYAHRYECSSPSYGCIQVAGLKVARYVLLFYYEASERTLRMEVMKFQEQAPLPPEQVEAYVDTPEYGHRHITDAQLVVQRVWEFAGAVLDLKPGERIFRSPEEPLPPPLETGLWTSREEHAPLPDAAGLGVRPR
jgi:hypothetical protein